MGSAGFTTVRDGYILGRNIVDPFCIPIQGLKFELVDGTVEAYGMDVTDNANVDELVVPEGQHIKDVILRSGWYIDQIG